MPRQEALCYIVLMMRPRKDAPKVSSRAIGEGMRDKRATPTVLSENGSLYQGAWAIEPGEVEPQRQVVAFTSI
jgi:hypothetical protein